MQSLAASSRSLCLGLLATTLVAACQEQPSDLVEDFSWQRGVDDVEEGFFATCLAGGFVFAAGGDDRAALFRWTGRRWQQEATAVGGARLHGCSATGPDNLFAVGDEGTILHLSAEGWFRHQVPEEFVDAPLRAVWSNIDGSAYAVGGQDAGLMLYYDGSVWSVVDDIADAPALASVWGAGNRVWAAGANGYILHFDGETWAAQDSGTELDIHALIGVSASEVYAAAGDAGGGALLAFDGQTWSTLDANAHALRALWTAAGRPLYAGGEGGVLLRYLRDDDGLDQESRAEVAPFAELRIEGLAGLSDSVLAVASAGDDEQERQGAIVSHGRSFAGVIVRRPLPSVAP